MCYYLGKHNKTTNRKKIHNIYIYIYIYVYVYAYIYIYINKIKQQQYVNIINSILKKKNYRVI